MLRLFTRWGITDEEWIFAFATASVELITNVVQHVHSLPRGKRRRNVRILFLKCTCERNVYVYAFVSDRDDEPIDVKRLKTRIRRPSLKTHGRGTTLVRALTDLYTIIRGTDGVIIMKKIPRR
jgi:anti-sigma regulatory factor (Ser/Thr protein kinase)